MGMFQRLKRHFSKKYPWGKVVPVLLNNKLMRWSMETKLFYWATMRRVKKITSTFDMPVNVQIESTNICNAKCVMCPNPDHERGRGYMTVELFKHIVDDLGTIPSIRELTLSGFGEPFLDKNLVEKIKYVKQHTNKSTLIYSNFSIMSEEKMNEILDSGLDIINISFNGSSKESYENTMKISFEKTLANLNRFIELKQARNATKPLIYVSCVLTQFNEDEANRLRQMWAGKVDGVYIGPPDNWVGGVNVRLKTHAKLNRPSKFAYPCKLYYPIINWNGDIGFCCRDYEGKEIFGNMVKEKFMDVWNSPRFVGFRNIHYSGKMISVCATCDVPYKRAGIKWWEPV
ncbi:radical SAM protein [Candidatus Woesearchaeota archaeon]|nr:radical SAM protein [Candidatus Woesearchaeota archaeon]